MKLWDKNISLDTLIEKFTIGDDKTLDLVLAKWDVLGTMAHIRMLEKVNLLSKEDLKSLYPLLKNLLARIEANQLTIDEHIEDIHSAIEIHLIEVLGDVGKKIHTARSRNDQVLLDIRLFSRSEIEQLVYHIRDLFNTLLDLSLRYKDVFLPGYTHFQLAMPSSFGLWLGLYAESLVDDLRQLHTCYIFSNRNPLGSAAGYGTTFPIDRKYTTALLGFDDMDINVAYAQFTRGKFEKTMSNALSSLAYTLAKISSDICVYMNQQFNFVSFPDEITTGSSIMPHKKNPDVFELIRGKCNKIQAIPYEINLITANLPSGYYRDLQMLKESYFQSFFTLKDCLAILNHTLKKMKVNKHILNDKYKHLFSVNEINKYMQAGIPFREAYKKVATDIREGTFNPKFNFNYTHEGSIGNLCTDEIKSRMEKTSGLFDFSKVNLSLKKLVAYAPDDTQKNTPCN